MAVTERAARVALALVALLLVGVTAAVDLPRLSGGQFWGDGATYHAMAHSLAEDHDLRYEARDVVRVRREFPSGPQGIFLKRTDGGFGFDLSRGFPWVHRYDWGGEPSRRPVYFAKANLYAVICAPLVVLLGTRGLLVTNALALSAALACGYVALRRFHTPAASLALTLVIFLAGVAPVYLLWPTPELVTLALVAGGLLAWSRGWPIASALLLGLAIYAKPYNLLLALPLGVEPLILGRFGWRAWLESVKRGALVAGTVILLFLGNAFVTGEMNYQGGERKTFYGTLPFERDSAGKEFTFGNSGHWMTTEQLGPKVEGAPGAAADARTGPPRDPAEIRSSFFRNLGYFWIGRFGGAAPYFLPVILAVLLFLVRGPRDLHGWLIVAALFCSYLFYLRMIPDNWYGGGGTVGNRYFLNLVPLALFLVPAGRAWLVVIPGVLWACTALAPILLHPMHTSLRPGDHTMRAPFRLLPPELTMLNDLAIFTEGWRKKQPVGDTEGDAYRGYPADPKAYYLYFLSGGTRGIEVQEGKPGFRLCGGSVDLVLRALEPVERMQLDVTGTGADELQIDVGGESQTLTLTPGTPAQAFFRAGSGFRYYDTSLYRLRLTPKQASACDAFVTIRLQVQPRR